MLLQPELARPFRPEQLGIYFPQQAKSFCVDRIGQRNAERHCTFGLPALGIRLAPYRSSTHRSTRPRQRYTAKKISSFSMGFDTAFSCFCTYPILRNIQKYQMDLSIP